MKAAVIIDAGREAKGLTEATRTQSLLLDHMGARLNSIRLAVPRLLRLACDAAVHERPDLLVLVGGPRAARRAGQVAYESRIPIIFLPGLRFPRWAKRLWGSLSLEELIAALEREKLFATHLAAGRVDGQIFFESASFGLLIHLAQLHAAFGEAETFSEAWRTLQRGVSLSRLIFRPSIQMLPDRRPARAVQALTVTSRSANAFGQASVALARNQFSCCAWHFPTGLGFLPAMACAAFGKDWRRYAAHDRIDCGRLRLESSEPLWLLLDGEPLPFRAPLEFELVPKAVETFSFRPEAAIANDNGLAQRSQFWNPGPEPRGRLWNLQNPSYVDIHDRRASGTRKERKQV